MLKTRCKHCGANIERTGTIWTSYESLLPDLCNQVIYDRKPQQHEPWNSHIVQDGGVIIYDNDNHYYIFLVVPTSLPEVKVGDRVPKDWPIHLKGVDNGSKTE